MPGRWAIALAHKGKSKSGREEEEDGVDTDDTVWKVHQYFLYNFMI
jgi:hypothetical protein